MPSADEIKRLLGREAARLVQPGMTVGLGSGSTAYWFIVSLGELVRQGLNVRGVPTSARTRNLAAEHGINMIELNDAGIIDVAVDGADEVSNKLHLIKGGGGALLQEKMVADASSHLVVIADETKFVQELGKFPLPVEVVPYGWKLSQKKIRDDGCREVNLRMRGGEVFTTDHGHFILDCYFDKIEFPATLHSKLNNIPGVVENGMFINMADTVLIGHADGNITEYSRE